MVGLTFGALAVPTAAHADESVEFDQAEQAAAIDYWTPERMAGAISGDTLLLGRVLEVTSNVERGVETVIPGIALPDLNILGLEGLGGLDVGGLGGLLGGGGSGGSVYTKAGTVLLTTGKVFFTMDGANYVCSGSSVTAPNRSLVQTAGHCVNAGPGANATNFVFVPGYRDGNRPKGTFAAQRLYTTSQWAGSGDLSYDVGYVVVAPVNGVSLTDTVGAQGIHFNRPRGGQMHAFGYPAAAPYDGEKLASCNGAVTNDTQGTADQGMNCNMTGGSSGGPWFTGFNETTGLGTVNSLNSFTYKTLGLLSDNRMYGPYFGTVIESLYNTASR